jgi:hypothetical protein
VTATDGCSSRWHLRLFLEGREGRVRERRYGSFQRDREEGKQGSEATTTFTDARRTSSVSSDGREERNSSPLERWSCGVKEVFCRRESAERGTVPFYT